MTDHDRRRARAFTLIELMIVVAIIGILAAVAIPAFLEYMKAGKASEAHVALNRLGKSARAYYVRQNEFPVMTEGPVPAASPCGLPNGTFTAGQFSIDRDPTGAFAELEFTVEEPFRFQYSYGSSDGVSFTADAVGNLDCDVLAFTVRAAGLAIDTGPTVSISEIGVD